MIITTFRRLSDPSKFLPALIALGVNAILFWGAVRVTSVLPPERVSRMPAEAVESCDRTPPGLLARVAFSAKRVR